MPWMRSGWEVLFQPLAISGSSEQVSFLGTSSGVEVVGMGKEERVMVAHKTQNLRVCYIYVNNHGFSFLSFFFDAIKMKHDESPHGALLCNGLLSRERLQVSVL